MVMRRRRVVVLRRRVVQRRRRTMGTRMSPPRTMLAEEQEAVGVVRGRRLAGVAVRGRKAERRFGRGAGEGRKRVDRGRGGAAAAAGGVGGEVLQRHRGSGRAAAAGGELRCCRRSRWGARGRKGCALAGSIGRMISYRFKIGFSGVNRPILAY